MNRVLLTGGTGCIGAATTKALVERGVDEVLIATSSGSPGSLGLWFEGSCDSRVTLQQADVADAGQIRQLVTSYRPTRIIHLGAFQSPDCDAYPIRGMEINVGGTLNMLNAAAELKGHLERFVFASSAAVYGPRSLYPGALIAESDTLSPPNLYGVWKVAGEHLARLFQQKTDIPTVCLRINTTYGKGRDKGKTSAPTTAMKAVAKGIPFLMPYFGRENYHFVEDVAAHFAATALQPWKGFGAFNIRGETIEVREFLALVQDVASELGMDEKPRKNASPRELAAETACPTTDSTALASVAQAVSPAAFDFLTPSDGAGLGIAADATPALFACDLDDRAIQAAFPGVPRTALREGIRKTLEAFR